MSWIEVRAKLPQNDDTSPFVEIYRRHGIENTLEDFEFLVGAMVEVDETEDLVAELKEELLAAGAIEVTSAPVPEVDWDEVWRQHFHPRRVGKHIVVRPTWENYAAQLGDIEVVLDPGEAFGTGDHATTRLCLELLEECDLKGKLVADVGCGSGILSIAAHKLGATVEAVDIELTAVAVTRENAALNGVSFKTIAGAGIESLYHEQNLSGEWEQDEHPLTAPVEVVVTGGIRPRYDLVVSNIISAVLIRISVDVFDALQPGGGWIVSGIIRENWPDVERAALTLGFVLEDRREEEAWVAARFRKP